MKIYLLFVFAFIVVSCKEKAELVVERVAIEPHILTNDVFTSLPGDLLVYNNYVVWSNETEIDGYVNVVDKHTGKPLSAFVRKGSGPEEFVTPKIAWAPDDKLLVYDINSPKTRIYSLTNAVNGITETNPIVNFNGLKYNKLNVLSDGSFMLFTPSLDKPFMTIVGEEKKSIGNFPVASKEKIVNSQSVFLGTVALNPFKKILAYSVGKMSYLALYAYGEGDVEKKLEKRFSEVDYTIDTNGQLIINNTPKYSPTAIALTKDYIVSIERDKQIPSPPSPKRMIRGRDFSKTPHTVFVYDYEMNLLKIVDLGIPVSRIASDGHTNELFFIGVKEDFCIGFCSLE